MKSLSPYFLAQFLLIGSALADVPAKTETPSAQIQAEQGQKQAYANVLWHYLSAVPVRNRQVDAASDQLYGLLAMEDITSGKLPDAGTLVLRPWQEDLATLRSLTLPPGAATSLKALEGALREAARALSAIPMLTANAPPAARIARQQALLAAAAALGTLKQQSATLDDQIQEAARRAAAGAHLLATQALMQPAPAKGEKQ